MDDSIINISIRLIYLLLKIIIFTLVYEPGQVILLLTM